MTAKEAMCAALEQAQLAREAGETPVGAVLIRENRVIAWAHNRCEQLRSATAHAEMIAIAEGARVLGDWRLGGCTLVVTLEPCAMCAGALVNARVERLVFGAFDPQFGACQGAVRLLDGALGRRLPFVGGILESECRALLDAHFFSRRGADREN